MNNNQGLFDFAAPRLGELSLSDVDFVSFDFETTGFYAGRDRVVEAGAVLWKQGEPVRHYVSLVQPEMPVPDAAYRVHGIGDDDLVGAPSELEVMEQLRELMDGCVVVAHNLPFDYAFLEAAWRRWKLDEFNSLYVDSLSFARKALPGLPAYSLEKLSRRFGYSTERSHRADSDAENCGRLLLHCIEQDPQCREMSVDRFIQYSGSRTKK